MNHLLQSLILVHETFQQFVIEKFDSELNDMELKENLLIVRIDLLTRYQELLVDEVLKLLLEEAHNVPHKVLVDALVEVALVLVFYRSERFEKRQERDAKEIQKRHEKRREKRYKRGKG